MTTSQAAKYLGLSKYYLRNLRNGMYEHDGPKYSEGKFRGIPCLVYTKEDCDEWNANRFCRHCMRGPKKGRRV